MRPIWLLGVVSACSVGSAPDDRAALQSGSGSTSPSRSVPAPSAPDAPVAARCPARDSKQLHERQQADCDSGEASACHRLAIAFRDGADVASDPAKAHELFVRACSLGDFYACQSADEPPERFTRAFEKARDACQEGSWVGCATLDSIVREAAGRVRVAPRVWRDALTRWRRTCDAEQVDGCIALSLAFENPQFGPPNAKRARDYTSKACELGHGGACLSIGQVRRACDLGESYGCALLARESQDLAEARALYIRSCELSSYRQVAACNEAAKLLENGDAGTIDRARATELREAATCAISRSGR